MDPAAESDDALIERARAGDEAALGQLVERHAPRVLRFGRKLCRDEDDARDVVQETLLAAARGLHGFRGAGRFTTWLYAIARSFCIKSRTRGEAAVPRRPLDDTPEDELGAGMPQAKLPDDQLASRELAAALEVAIRALPPDQREVLVLRDVEGLTAPEVAEVLDLRVEAVKSRLHRARRALRDALAPVFGDGPAPPTCPDVVDLLSRYQEGDVTQQVCRDMQEHVEGCPACAARCDSLRTVLSTCSATPEAELPDELRERIRSELRRIASGASAT